MRTRASLSACLRYPPSVTGHSGQFARRSSSLTFAGGLSQSSDFEPHTFPLRRPKCNATHSRRHHGSRPIPLSSRRAFSRTSCTRVSLDFDESESPDEAFRRRRGRLGNSRDVPRDLRALLRSRSGNIREKRNSSAQKDPRLSIHSAEEVYQVKLVEDVPQTPPAEETRRIEQEKMLQSLPSISSLNAQLCDISDQVWAAYISHFANEVRHLRRELGHILLERSRRLETDVGLLSNEIVRSTELIQLAEHEYCKIAFAQSPALQVDVSRVVNNVHQMRKKVFMSRSTLLSRQVQKTRRLIRKLSQHVSRVYLKPRQSARKNVQVRLADLTNSLRQYAWLRKIYLPVKEGLRQINSLLIDLSRAASFSQEQRDSCDALARGFYNFYTEIIRRAHFHRQIWLLGRRINGRAADSLLKPLSAHSRSSLRMTREQILETVALGHHANPQAARHLAKFRRGLVWQLWSLYASIKSTPKPARSPELDIRWRQLDVMAPFMICARSSWRTAREIWYLSVSLHPQHELWSMVSFASRNHIKRNLDAWRIEFEDQREKYIEEFTELTLINSLRLKLETELHEKGWPNEMLARGLFVPTNPLSQDTTRFRQWTYEMEAIHWDAFVASRAWEMNGNYWDRLSSKLEKLNVLDQFKSQVPTLGSQTVGRAHRYRIKRQSKSKNSGAASIQRPAEPVQQRPLVSSQGWRRRSRAGHFSAHRVRKGRKQSLTTKHRVVGPRMDGGQQQPRKHAPAKPDWSPKARALLRRLPRALLRRSGNLKHARRLIKEPNPSQLRGKLNKSPAKLSSVSNKGDCKQDRVAKLVEDKHAAAKVNWNPNQSTQQKKVGPRHSAKTLPKSIKDEPKTGKKDAAEATKPQKWTAEHFKSKTRPVKRTPKSTKSTEDQIVPAPDSVSPLWRSKNIAARSISLQSRQHKRSYGTRATPCRNKSEDSVSHVSTSEPPAPLGPSSVSFTEIASDSPCASRASGLSGQVASETNCSANDAAPPQFWSHNSRRAPSGQSITVHYCRSLQNTEEVAQRFLESKVLGFDMEWKAQSFGSARIQSNLSLIQIANEERIGLFHIALFRPARTLDDFVAPSLKRLLESPNITKVGVSIKGDCTRLRRYLGIEAKSIFELSYLYKLVKHGQANPKLVNKRSVNLSEQVEEHFGLPLEKSDDVRCGDWTRPLNYRQVQYAAADPYACLCLFHAMEIKRQAMDPMPPCPAHAELNLPIILPHGQAVDNDDKELPVSEPDTTERL